MTGLALVVQRPQFAGVLPRACASWYGLGKRDTMTAAQESSCGCTRMVRATYLPRGTSMKKLISILMSAAILTASLALVPSTASAKTEKQIRDEQKGAAAKAKSKAKSDAKKGK